MLLYCKNLVKSLVVVFLAAPLFLSCYNYDRDEEVIEKAVKEGENYICLTIAVNMDNRVRTRAPQGGENGDGREAGFQRENEVTGITLILYEDATGINTTDNPSLTLVKYFPTTFVSRDAAGLPQTGTHNSGSDKSDLDEAYYTTGDQLVKKNELTFGKPYHAIVVANKDLTSVLSTTSKLNDVKALVYGQNDLYNGDYGKTAYRCHNFMMSSEYDCVLDFTTPTTVEPNKVFYRPENPIRIERLAARIDFWAAGGIYTEKVDKGGTSTDIYGNRYGYVYNVEGSSDKFVVVSITPFNLYSKGTTYGGEKLLKQLSTGYLEDETTTNYVLDPSTDQKTTTNVTAFGTDGTYLNPLSQIYTDLNASSPKSMSAAGTIGYYQTVKAMHDKIGLQGGYDATFNDNVPSGTKTGENVIVAYPMENTLPEETTPTTPLYTYATGIAIEGDYYKGGDLTVAPTGTRVYMGYLMHQNGTATYAPFKSDDATVTTAVPTTTPMNYGVVRNNIYRVSIDKITPDESLVLKIKVKMWDPFWHGYIYM